MIEGYLDQGKLPRQGRRLRRPGGRRRVRRPAQGGLRQRRRLSRGKGPAAPGPVPRPRRSRSRSRTSISRRAPGRPRPTAASSSSRAPSPARPSGSRSSGSAAPPASPRSSGSSPLRAAASSPAVAHFGAVRRLSLPAPRLRDAARAQGTAPPPDARGGRRSPRRPRPSSPSRPRRTSTATGTRWSSPSARSSARLVLGLREKVTASRQTYRRTLPIEECPIFGPVVERVFPVRDRIRPGEPASRVSSRPPGRATSAISSSGRASGRASSWPSW